MTPCGHSLTTCMGCHLASADLHPLDPVRLHFAALVQCTINPDVSGHDGVGIACDRLREIKESNLINRKSC